ncbi:hypothetical protein Enr13x_70920 [Stieleria neptunia]|uniref:Uncharacterized protein n=1 Tax=Stieleria neptunia TaxID=2527979 RepID=A0A518I248_9BACT|nr:hypothetical protein Enr13x_70920 [Stieleria neptunia]
MASYPTVSDSNSLVKLYHPPYASLVASANWKNFPVVPVGRDWLTLPGARRRARAAPIFPLPCKFSPSMPPVLTPRRLNQPSQRPRSNHQIHARVQFFAYNFSRTIFSRTILRVLSCHGRPEPFQVVSGGRLAPRIVPTDGDSFLECVQPLLVMDFDLRLPGRSRRVHATKVNRRSESIGLLVRTK